MFSGIPLPNINELSIPSKLAQLSETEYRNALTKGQSIENQFMPDKLKLANAFQALQNQYYAPNIQSEISNRNALTNKYNVMTPLEAKELSLKNQFYQPNIESEISNRNALTQGKLLENQYYPDLTKAQIENYKAMANYKNMGGGNRGGVGTQEMNALVRQVMQDNPTLKGNYEQANQIASAYLDGLDNINGTPIPQPSGLSKALLNQITKRGTGTQLVNKAIQAKQSDAELKTLEKYANEGLKPYGNTVLGKSPQQIADTFKSDSASQERLGKFMASQALQYEIAQIRNRIAQGESGITATHELMGKSGQIIDARFPFLSGKAREVAAKTIDEALEKGLNARGNIDIGAFNASKAANNSSNKESTKATVRYNPQTGDFEEIK